MCFVFSPGASAADQAEELIERVRDHIDTAVFRLGAENDRTLADDLRGGAYERIIVAGGDGTINRVVQALAPDFPTVELALLPLGTGNDFARSLGIDADDLDTALDRALVAQARPVDVVRTRWNGEESWFVNVANGGIGGRVVHEMDEGAKKRWGVLAYWAAGVASVLSPDAYQVRLLLDGAETQLELCGLLVANGRFVGGGYPVAPDAAVDDGWLDVVAVPVLSPMELMADGIDVYLERAIPDGVGVYRARKVEIESTPAVPFSIDGEPHDTARASFEIEAGAVHMVPGAGKGALAEAGATQA